MEENASNALMMAGSVLIGLIVLSAFIAMFASFTNSSMQIEERLAEAQLKEFNSKYEVFTQSSEENGDETSRVTIYDIVSLINYTKQYNHEMYSDDECSNYDQGAMPYYVVVEINFGGLRARNNAIKNKTSSGSKPYQEAPQDTLDVFLKNAYYDGEHAPDVWAEGKDYILRFKCEGIYYNDITGRVNRISFELDYPDWW